MCVSWAHFPHGRDVHGRLLWGTGSMSPPFSQLHRVGQEGMCLTHRPGPQGLECQANKLRPLPGRNGWVPWEGLGRKALWPEDCTPYAPGHRRVWSGWQTMGTGAQGAGAGPDTEYRSSAGREHTGLRDRLEGAWDAGGWRFGEP